MYKLRKRIVFKSLLRCDKGLIFSILSRSYNELIMAIPSYKSSLVENWKSYEQEVYKNPSTIGKCGFITLVDGNPVGFASWDPRGGPKVGLIGHNCILPDFRNKSFGKMQVKEIIRILREQKFHSIIVTTGEHEFFLPAQKMYESCGFIEERRLKDPSNPYFKIIEYSKKFDISGNKK
jgi:GNAT superfamily N-acetyltransferase